MRFAAFSAPLLLALAVPAAAQTIGEVQTKAAAGDRESQFVLGEAYRTGQGVTPDREQAITWFRKAAAQGDTRAGDALGLLLFTKGERRESIPLLEAAETRQDARALYLLGTARFNGDGVPKDLPRAYAEMRTAANMNLPQAIRSLQLMEPYLTDRDRMASNTIQPGRTPLPPAQPAVAQSTGSAPATLAPLAAPAAATPTPATPAPLPRPAPVFVPRPAPAPIQTTAVPPSAPAEPIVTPPPVEPLVAPPPRPAASMPRPAATPTPAMGKWRVQLGSLISADKAEEQWRTLLRKLPELSRLSHTSVQANGMWRLQATGLASRSEAQDLCKAVTAKGGNCIALNPLP
ncbi:SPOR domain-containing protein [Sphingomonas sp. BIUV-7]|uniref:SPOR domain-containing protein n=1 Tax=Sphingomonas natans TaxID=3063330 RepID=A0ABT8Y513_9SPHN|nr:SPOR domain-containing protein [Sphingomonas sp. BIUV-7]MDO6413407.1 SPOR domain-containing protein [Sphingomonas sp. BIUV-7]